jgi:hypothetical protein
VARTGAREDSRRNSRWSSLATKIVVKARGLDFCFLHPECSWLLAPGSWLLAPGSWLLAPGSWLLATGYWLRACLPLSRSLFPVWSPSWYLHRSP